MGSTDQPRSFFLEYILKVFALIGRFSAMKVSMRTICQYMLSCSSLEVQSQRKIPSHNETLLERINASQVIEYVFAIYAKPHLTLTTRRWWRLLAHVFTAGLTMIRGNNTWLYFTYGL